MYEMNHLRPKITATPVTPVNALVELIERDIDGI